jgi:YgiT-type zinc finger domain-containing protein
MVEDLFCAGPAGQNPIQGTVMAQAMRSFHVSACPACGSTRIRSVRGDWSGTFKRKRYVVKDLRYFHCPRCGEKVYSPDAMRRIQAVSPAFSKTRRVRKTA